MPQRNIDLLQDAWHAAGRYQRAEHLDPRTRKLIDAMFPPIVQGQEHDAVDDPLADLVDIGTRILAAVGTQAMTKQDIADALGVKPATISKAIAAVAAEGHLVRSHSAPGRVSRYWRPKVAADAA